METLLARGFQSGAQGASESLLLAPEAERIVECLREHDIEQVGTSKWLEQQEWVQKLNVQSHHNATSHADEFVKDFLVSYDKVNVLIHELLVMEIWREKLLPHLKKHLATKVNSVTVYLLISHEAALANLLEITLFHDQALDNVQDDYLLELIDWCQRQLHYLNKEAYSDAVPCDRVAMDLLNRTDLEELEERLKETRVAVAMCAVTIVRYISDAASRLPVSMLSRLLVKNDVLMALVPLADNPPWRREHNGALEQLDGSQWVKIEPQDRFKLSNTDAQVWLALNNLVVDPNCRAKYNLDDFRKETLMGLKRFMNQLLIDQLPVLTDLQRVLDELAFNYQPNLDGYSKGGLVIEQVAAIRGGLLRCKDWAALAEELKRGPLSPEAAAKASQRRMEGLLEAFNFLVDSSMGCGDKEDRQTDKDTGLGVIKLSLYRKPPSGAMQPWSDIEFHVDRSKDPVKVSLKGENGIVVKGTRWTLDKVDADSRRAFPSNGRAVATHNGSTAEALLELPTPATKAKDDMHAIPAALWVTIGLLAQDKLALQLRLMRCEQPRERDKEGGTWHVYHATGGAITVLEGIEQPNTVDPKTSKIQTLTDLDLD